METFKYQTAVKTILADLHTPVGVYMRLRDVYPQSALMESSDYHGTDNARSFIGIRPTASIAVSHGKVIMTFPDGTTKEEVLPESGPRKGEAAKLKIADAFNRFIKALRLRANVRAFVGSMALPPSMR
jgi:anthranilate synthase component 1